MPYKSKASALFNTRYKKNKKREVNEKWYRKAPITVNVKLRQTIIDALPFDMDKKQADLILRTIFDTIANGVIEDGFVTIEGLGRFFKRFHKECISVRNERLPNGTFGRYLGPRWLPERHSLAFRRCRNLMKSVNTEDADGNNGTS